MLKVAISSLLLGALAVGCTAGPTYPNYTGRDSACVEASRPNFFGFANGDAALIVIRAIDDVLTRTTPGGNPYCVSPGLRRIRLTANNGGFLIDETLEFPLAPEKKYDLRGHFTRGAFHFELFDITSEVETKVAERDIVPEQMEPYVAPAANGYVGPTAILTDSYLSEDGHKAQFFVVSEIDGTATKNALDETREASRGGRFNLAARSASRRIPARPVNVKLLGTHSTGAPIHEIVDRIAGNFLTVEGVVNFAPLEGGKYIVRGELDKSGSAVWIEDGTTHQVVSERITSKK